MLYLCGFILPHFFHNGFSYLFPVATIKLKDIGRIDRKEIVVWRLGYSGVNMPIVAMASRRKDLLCLS